MSEPLPAEFASALRATATRRGHLGLDVHYFSETSSTNDIAATYAERGAAEGTVVVAGAQTSGRGRFGRVWHSPPGAGLYMSIVFRDPKAASFLTLAAGVAVVDGVRAATGLPLEIKWPNDVVAAGTDGPAHRRKIAGILAEGSSTADGLQHVVLGIGINISPAAYPREVATRASSIETELGRAADAGPIFAEVLAALAERLKPLSQGDASGLLARWRTLSPWSSGSAVECDTPSGRASGIAAGIADDGALLVRIGDRVERIIAGEVIWK
jgi:BirA family transcriptional regulator, biotin operon repressor / biotin---[acetyl-CoA-carboxylase] ligase